MANFRGEAVFYIFSKHAEEELRRREIPEDLAISVLLHPEQIVDGYNGTKVFQSCVVFPNRRLYLLRIVVNVKASPILIITAYKTTQLKKYWGLR
ncbi:DUF4258 domain-containing protein [Bdellovibrio sp.]|uniref:DUF4258 domain-containing protein n=1 Tax=Bdellovibrio sp. TaxID=28201 RepID=UPI0039E6F31D